MYEISREKIRRVAKTNSAGRYVPLSVDLSCPSCRSSVTFRLDNWNGTEAVGLPKAASCPRCRDNARFIWLDGSSEAEGDGRLFIDSEIPEREPLVGLDLLSEEEFSPGLRRAYRSALNVLNIGEAEAAAASFRRVLEGIARQLVPDAGRNTPLAERLRRFANEADIKQPLIELTDTLRRSGNLGAHFDEEREETSIGEAYQMLDFLEFFIEYVYVLPRRIDEFRQSLQSK